MDVATASDLVLPDLGIADVGGAHSSKAHSAPHDVTPKSTPSKCKPAKAKSGKQRARKRKGETASSVDGIASKAAKSTTVKTEQPDDPAKFSNALTSAVAVITLEADNASVAELQGAAESTDTDLTTTPVASTPKRRFEIPKEPMSTRRSLRGAKATPGEVNVDEKPADYETSDAVKLPDAKNVDAPANKPVAPGASNSPLTLIHPSDLSSDSSDDEET